MKQINLKYPLYLFIAIFVAKFGYVIVESFYNYYVLVTTTSADVTIEKLEDLNENGHLISAFGLTVLLVPLYYFFVKNKDDKIIYTTLSIATIVTFISVYNLLNVAVDNIVSSNKEKRYDAFYITLFKYGLLNNKFAYNSFIDSKKIADNNLSVNDRILLTNSFLLLHADQKLIDRLRKRGKEVVADMYIEKYAKDDYDTKYKAFKKATEDISKLWREFNKARAKLDSEIKQADDKTKLKKAYKKLLSNLKQSYYDYKHGWEKVDKEIAKRTTKSELDKVGEKLVKYFKYQNYDSAKEKYRKAMYANFGHYVKPSRWKDENGELTYTHVKQVITDEILKKAGKKLTNLPKGMSQKQFANYYEVKVEVSKRLKQKGIQIPYEFNYTFKEFKKYYEIAVNRKINQAPKIFYKKLRKKIGKNDLKLDMDWHGFVHSNYIRYKVKLYVDATNKKDIQTVLNVIESKDLGNFKKMLYIPKIIKQIEEKYEYTKEDFLDAHKAAKIGDESIKALYIPPFALAVSIIALLLNLVTILGMSLKATKIVPSKAILVLQVMFIVVIIATPMVTKHDSFNNPMIEKISNDDIKTYLKFLNWISYYETINSDLHK